jgi:hypothetical protein
MAEQKEQLEDEVQMNNMSQEMSRRIFLECDGRVAEQLAKGDVQKWCINGPAFPIAKSIGGEIITSKRIAFDQITNFNQFQIWLQQNAINVGWLNNLTVRKTENKTILFRDLSSIQLSNTRMNHLILADGTNLTPDDFDAYLEYVGDEMSDRQRQADIREERADDIELDPAGDPEERQTLLLQNERDADNGPRETTARINPIKITSNVYQSEELADYLYTEPNIRETIDKIEELVDRISDLDLVDFGYAAIQAQKQQEATRWIACTGNTKTNIETMRDVATDLYSKDSVEWDNADLNGLVNTARALNSTVKRLLFLTTKTLFDNNLEEHATNFPAIKEASSECAALVVQVQYIAKLFAGLFYTYTITAVDVSGTKFVDTPAGVTITVPIPTPRPRTDSQIRVRIPVSATFVNEEVETYYHRRLHYWKHQLLIEHDDAQVMYNVDKWYQKTPWAIGKIFFSPLIYGHMHEVHHAVTRCHPTFKDHGIKHLAEHHCFLFAKCVALAIRGSTILSGKRYGLDRSFMRINMEKRRAMHAWKHEDEKKAEADIKADKQSATSTSTALSTALVIGDRRRFRPFSELVRGI